MLAQVQVTGLYDTVGFIFGESFFINGRKEALDCVLRQIGIMIIVKFRNIAVAVAYDAENAECVRRALLWRRMGVCRRMGQFRCAVSIGRQRVQIVVRIGGRYILRVVSIGR